MSDSPAEFAHKTAVMVERVNDHLALVAKYFIIEVGNRLVDDTPGFGNQYPEDTSYIPTGRLRGGWQLTSSPLGRVSKGLYAARGEEGPFSDYGAEVKAAIAAEVMSSPLPRVTYLANDVGYGHIVHEGLGNHTIDRPWVKNLADPGRQRDAARAAIIRAGTR